MNIAPQALGRPERTPVLRGRIIDPGNGTPQSRVADWLFTLLARNAQTGKGARDLGVYARALGVPAGTVRWALDELIAAGRVEAQMPGVKRGDTWTLVVITLTGDMTAIDRL